MTNSRAPRLQNPGLVYVSVRKYNNCILFSNRTQGDLQIIMEVKVTHWSSKSKCHTATGAGQVLTQTLLIDCLITCIDA